MRHAQRTVTAAPIAWRADGAAMRQLAPDRRRSPGGDDASTRGRESRRTVQQPTGTPAGAGPAERRPERSAASPTRLAAGATAAAGRRPSPMRRRRRLPAQCDRRRPASGTGPSGHAVRGGRRRAASTSRLDDGEATDGSTAAGSSRRVDRRRRLAAASRRAAGPAPPTGAGRRGRRRGRLPSTSSASSASGSSSASGYGVPLTLQTTSSSSLLERAGERVHVLVLRQQHREVAERHHRVLVPQRDQPPVVGEHRRAGRRAGRRRSTRRGRGSPAATASRW